jgi:uncharacterized protein YjbJ (UPF0337 family)
MNSQVWLSIGKYGSSLVARKRRSIMNWDFIEGNWDQIKSKIKKHWGRLTDDELEVMDGKRDDFLGRLQERYGITKQEAERQVEEFHRLRLQSDEARKLRY